MAEFRHARCFRDLTVYQKSIQIADYVFNITKKFPKEEMFSLTDQIRRSSRSIGAQIAEAWGKRRYEKHFISKLTDADAEQLETQHWLHIAVLSGYLTIDHEEKIRQQLREIGKMLHAMILKASTFCGNQDTYKIREETEYFQTEN